MIFLRKYRVRRNIGKYNFIIEIEIKGVKTMSLIAKLLLILTNFQQILSN